MTAIDALCVILESGGRVVPGPERPRLLAPPRMRPLVDAHREGLRALVHAYGHCTADVFRRAQVFRQQINTWTASGRFGFPVLVLPGAATPTTGRCISCGAEIGDGWRCATCLEAVHVALTLTTWAEE